MAASPMPGAWYMVSSMSSHCLRTSASTAATGLEIWRSVFSSGRVMMGRSVMGVEIGEPAAPVNPPGASLQPSWS